MYSSVTRRKRSLMNRLFSDQIQYSNKSKPSVGYRVSTYIKLTLCILILYCLNLLFGFKSYLLFEKSFEDEYHLTIKQIDITKIEENVEQLLGQPNNVLSNRFLIGNEYLCGRSLDPKTMLYPHLIILIKSNCENFKERQAIRLTWGNKNHSLKSNIRLAFVLGINAQNTSVKEESKKYGDIIQIDKLDYYYYSSYKMIMMLRWINDYCSSKSPRTSYIDLRKYVLFVDDDYYIDIDLLLSYIHGIDSDPDITTYERRTFITGELIRKTRPQRFVNDRWYVSLIDYPYNAYPSYLSTGCFLMTRYNARLFYIASKYTRLFHFDHIYMGLLAYSMSTKLIQNNELFSTSLETKNILLNQIFTKNSTKNSICYRGFRAEKLLDIWNDIHQTNLTLSFDLN